MTKLKPNYVIVTVGLLILIVGIFLAVPSTALTVVKTGNGGTLTFNINVSDINSGNEIKGDTIYLLDNSIANSPVLYCTTGTGGVCTYQNMQAGAYTITPTGSNLPTGYCSGTSFNGQISNSQTIKLYLSPCTTTTTVTTHSSTHSSTTTSKTTSRTTSSTVQGNVQITLTKSASQVLAGSKVSFIATITDNGNAYSGQNLTIIQGSGSGGGISSKLSNNNGQANFTLTLDNAGTFSFSVMNNAGITSNAQTVSVTGTTTTASSSTTTTATITQTITTTSSGSTFTVTNTTTITATLTSGNSGLGSTLASYGIAAVGGVISVIGFVLPKGKFPKV